MSTITVAEAHQLWDSFLNRWPLESLSQMTLDQYSNAGATDTFTYWLESQTEQLGSIWGGSAFKFGIFSRKDRSPKTDNARVRYSDEYGWSAKYGDSPQVAFQNVRNIIIDIAQAARRGDLGAVDRADLGVVTKWKIAFLYQDRERPCVLPLYKEASLRIVGGLGKTESPAAMHSALMADLGERDLIEYGRDLWTRAEEILAEQWSGQRVLEILNANEELAAIKAPTSKIAGFRLEDGRELGLDLSPKVPLIYLEPGEWMSNVGGEGHRVTEYPPERTRHSNLAANAPRLGSGHPAVQVVVPDESSLERLLAAYVSSKSPTGSHPTFGEKTAWMKEEPLNQILFGPPGTGKTYHTVNAALEILDPDFLSANTGEDDDTRRRIKARFDELVHQERIRLVTFHQSFSYEDFVEGLRAITDDESGQIRYEVVDGVFKSLCEAAASRVTRQTEAPAELGQRRVWKMSLGNTLGDSAAIYQECIEGNYVLLGYGGNIDFAGCKDRSEVQQRFAAHGVVPENPNFDYGITSVTTFVSRMRAGDLVVVSDGNFKFRAIGEIVGDYAFKPHEDYEANYSQMRPVKWLRQYQPSLPHTELMNNQFSQMTLYELRSPALDLEKLSSLLGTRTEAQTSPSATGSVFEVGEVFGRDYRVIHVGDELLELTKPNGKRLGLAMNMLEELAGYVREGTISVEDIRNKLVFDKVPESRLEPFLVHGYNNILPSLVEKILVGPGQPGSAVGVEGERNVSDARVLIIDEINRGNISRIFGELITLIEPSKRMGAGEALSVLLPYSKRPFGVPANLHLIGTMNTADRSLAGLDIALRRRFVFREMPPRPELLDDVIVDGLNIGRLLRIMNQRIDVLLDRDHCLGHTYFFPLRKDNNLGSLSNIFRFQIIPLLQEYFFEDWERIRWVLNDQSAPQGLEQFITAPGDEERVEVLFGRENLGQVQDRRWRVNDRAFESINSYRNILGEAR